MTFSFPPMPDVSHLAAIAAICAGLTTAWCQLLKPLIEAKLGPASPMHDPAIRYTAAALAVVFLLLGVYVPAAFNVVAIATGIAVGSYGSFHLITSNPFAPTPTEPPVSPPAPTPPAGEPNLPTV